MLDSAAAFFKSHGIDLFGVFAAFVGGGIIISRNSHLTLRQSGGILASGIAVNAYLVPLALHLLGFEGNGPVASAAGFISGLIGMQVVAAFTKWADKIENPADFLRPFDHKRDDQ